MAQGRRPRRVQGALTFGSRVPPPPRRRRNALRRRGLSAAARHHGDERSPGAGTEPARTNVGREFNNPVAIGKAMQKGRRLIALVKFGVAGSDAGAR